MLAGQFKRGRFKLPGVTHSQSRHRRKLWAALSCLGNRIAEFGREQGERSALRAQALI